MKHTRRGVTLTVALASLVAAVATFGASTPTSAQTSPSNSDWLGIVNTYRAQSGLAPVTENTTWSAGARNHSCWMLQNDIAHDEAPGTPGYTTDGDQAGNNGNVAVSSNGSATARSHIDLWMTGPFHAIGLLRSSLTSAGFGMCSSPPNPTKGRWNSGGTLDVLRGINPGIPRSSVPVVFPGNGATTSLTRFVAESPDPRTFCGWGAQSVGLPLIALMPSPVSGAIATLSGPSGPVPTCVLTRTNTNGTASAILGGDNAVVVMPSAPLAAGTYTAAVMSDGGNAGWSFTVDPNAPLSVNVPPPGPLGTTSALTGGSPVELVSPFRFADSRVGQRIGRLPANQLVRLRVAGEAGLPSGMTAVSANFTAANATSAGYLTASNCAESNPSFSTLNFDAYDGVPNQAIIALDRGDICLFASVDTDIIVDVNGYAAPNAGKWFSPVQPQRLLDTRSSQPLRAGEVLRVDVEGGSSPAPDSAVAVAVNLTGVLPDVTGFVRAFPCDVGEPDISSINPRVGAARANSAIIPTAADGTICLTSNVTTNILIDITGWFGPFDGRQFVPLTPIRLTDTRQSHPELNGGSGARLVQPGESFRIQVAGNRGVPSDSKAATLNLVALGGGAAGFLTVMPCGTGTDVSNLNYPGFGAVANGTSVKLDGGGAVCVTTSAPTHLIVDITGVWR
jgi:uncharacterized protein YkwD